MKLFQITLGVLIWGLIACNSRNDLGALDSVSVDTMTIDTASVDTTNTLNIDVNGLNQEISADKQAFDILEKLFQITGVSFTGSSVAGNVKGEATFRFNRNNLNVNYSLLQYSTTEDGNLENFQIEEEGIENTIKIFADWNNTDESVGDGKFFLRLSPDYPKNLYFEIRGSSWIHYAYRELNDEEFKKVKQILSSKTNTSVGFDEYPSNANFQNNKFVEIDSSSNKDALEQLAWAKERRGEGFIGTANFASYYEILIYGVGTGCQQAVMIDLRDGKLYGVPIDCPACGDDEYIDFKINSKLLVNSFCLNGKTIKYNVWDEQNKKFKEIIKPTSRKN